MSAEERYVSLMREISEEFPRFRLVRKNESRLQRALHLGLVTLTFGKMRGYLHDYQTTIGATVYVTPDWDERAAGDRYVTMRHERVHLRQFRRLGLPVMAVLYLLLPVPMGLASFRAQFEKEAYAETILAASSVYGEAYVRSPGFRDAIIGQFCGPAYGWMWPFRRSLERWYDGVLA